MLCCSGRFGVVIVVGTITEEMDDRSDSVCVLLCVDV